ncbi:MAG TPA: MG2 domain-containing protein, partial [Candidatus Anammoximicrobium sp.]|nr:MG2 domain-containing protein [Candidatus Anammoximicrobium sp.]
ADAYFKPPQEDQEPDYEKALDFYGRALSVGPKLDCRVRVELLIGQCQQKLNKLKEAADLYRKFLREHVDHPLVVEARFRLGETLLASKQPAEAREAWQDLLDLHEGSASDLLPQAAFRMAETYQLPAPENEEQLSLGVAALRRFLENFPKHALASKAQLWIGLAYRNRGHFADAAATLTAFLGDERYAKTEEIPDARNLLGMSYKMQGKFDQALAVWKEFLAQHPTHPAWSAVQREIVNTEYAKAADRYQRKDYAAARQLWSEFLAKYPLDARSRATLYLLAQMSYAEEKWDAALSQWRQLATKYPKTEEASRAQLMIARTLEEKLGKLDEALVEYRKLDWGRSAAEAKRRIARLTAKAMTIATERVFRSDETPQLKLVTRNIESVTVRVFTVDMETYFRKMHEARGVETLDIALIDPDQTFEYKVADYKPYQRYENHVPVPLPAAAKAGVMAVTVSSRTLEATTLLLQSDLDIVVKSSRDEVFVFAENLRTGQPSSKAKILLSNGTQVFGEGETNENGVFQKSFEELKSGDDVRVFAVADGHMASNILSLDGLEVAQGLSDKGYIYTDRPAYRPGQMVHVRGVVRKVSGDTYTVVKGKAYRVDVYDSRNRLIHDAAVTLNDYGSFHTHFLLTAAASAGDYRILVHDVEDKENYQGAFAVHDYQLEPVRLAIDTPRAVYYRGEKIEGVIRASYYYGAPLAGREIRYSLLGGRVTTAKTDDAGEVHFALETREFRESQQLVLSAGLAERNLVTRKGFFLSTQGFSLSAKTVRDVYLAGETFELKVTAADAEGKPIEQPLTVDVLRHTEIDGRQGEVSVGKHELKTAADGVARQTLQLAEGGSYTLRIGGVDRFQNAIETEVEVRISDDKDNVRLRILADQHTFQVGDTAQLRLHWREQPALALVTFEGAKILDYQLVRLQNGENKLTVPMTAKLAPNFNLAVAVMTDVRQAAKGKPSDDEGREDEQGGNALPKRFHEASSPFQVERDLKVAVQIQRTGADKKSPLRPGKEVQVTLTATDPQGKPAVAELSLAMVEQALLSRFPATIPATGDFFRSTERAPAVRTAASITFEHRPETKPINPRLLAESERLAVAEDEARRLAEVEVADRIRLAEENRAVADERQRGGSSGGLQAGYASDPFGVVAAEDAALTTEMLAMSDRRIPAMPGGGAFGAGSGGMGGMGGFGAAAPQMGGFAAAPAQQMAEQQKDQPSVTSVVPVVDLSGVDAGKVLAILKTAAPDGAVLLRGLSAHETGYWNPAVVTGPDGKATLTFVLPDRSTGWSLLAKGITQDTLGGEARQEFTVRKDLFGELKCAAAYTDGDKTEVVVSVHNDAVEKGEIQVALTTRLGDKSNTETKKLPVAAKGIQELSFQQTLQLPPEAARKGQPGATAEFELTVTAGDRRDVVRRSVPVRPFGLPVYGIAGGTAAGDAAAVVQSPPGMMLSAPRLQILIGPTIERSLLDAVLAPATWCQAESRSFASDGDSTASDLMASLALQKLLGLTRDAAGAQAESLDARVRAAVSLLVSQQNDDGGWSWSAAAGCASNSYHSARALWALSLARAAGYRLTDEAYDKAVNFVKTQLAQSPVADYETKAVLLHALTVAGHGDFPLANALYRNRPSLSPAALAYLALTFADMDRKQTAAELLTLLGNQPWEAPVRRGSPDPAETADRQVSSASGRPAVGAVARSGDRPQPASGDRPQPASGDRPQPASGDRPQPASGDRPQLAFVSWNLSPAEVRAIYALALDAVTPAEAKLQAQIDWLMAHRTGHRWSPDKATGPAMLAVCRSFARSQFDSDKYKLTIYVNNFLAKELEIDASAPTQTVDVPAELLKKDQPEQRVRFELAGRGRYTYQCVLGGFVPADQLKSTTSDWRVTRHYGPGALELDGLPIPRGFDVAVMDGVTEFRNDMTQLPVGRRGIVELRVWRGGNLSAANASQMPYLVVTEALPAGTAVVEDSVQGPFERFELSPGAITFYLGNKPEHARITYELHGYVAGAYRATPTLVRDAFRPDQIAVAEPKSLAVLPAGAAGADAYRLTPQELFELGRRHLEKGDLAAAAKHLNELFNHWNLKPEAYKETVRMLLDIHLQQGPPSLVVKYFEIIIEKFPELEISFAKLLKVADAYHEIGEYERSYLVFRATVEANFLRESRAAGFLESQQEFLRSVDVMSGLLRQYPPEPYLATATYALAQRVYAKAPDAASDAKLREKKVARVDLIRDAWQRLDEFLAIYPEDPAADQASFSLANALLDLELYDRAIAQCDRYAVRYPGSDYLDSYWYIIGYCHYARG